MSALPLPSLSFPALANRTATETPYKSIEKACRETGALLVTDVPNLASLRTRALRSIFNFATQPETVKQKYVNSESPYANGWSHGIEKLENGEPDRQKGSFYFNPCLPLTTSADVGDVHGLHHGATMWPTEVPEMESACLELSEHIHSVVQKLVDVLDHYLSDEVEGFVRGSLTHIIQSSTAHKGRGLCYFPTDETRSATNWCGEHVDHGVVTALVASAFLHGPSGDLIPCPDDQSGLYIRDTSGVARRVTFRQDAMLFQFGETLQILSGGVLPATWHYVAPIQNAAANDVYRIAFALFFNPEVDVRLTSPNDRDCGVAAYRKGETFAQFSRTAFLRYF